MTLEDFFRREVVDVARDLLGARLTVGGVGGLIVETEAYHPSEPASHAHRGQTPRNAAMFSAPGRAYVYRSYGLHWCLNFVCAGAAAVLIRAIEPTDGLEIMADRRGLSDRRALCSGPGKLCAALGVDRALDGRRLDQPPFSLHLADRPLPALVGPRIGITKAADLPWRFGAAGSPYLSRGFPRRPSEAPRGSPAPPG
jgi:DNA-3-methyladenine glycosylase